MQPPGPTVLVVDSDVVLAQAIERALEREGYTVTLAQSAEVAQSHLGQCFFDALVLDPHMDQTAAGWALFDRIVAMPDAPIVIVATARPDVRGAVEAMRRGASDFLEKPLDLADLSMRLRRAMETATLQRRLAALEAQGQVRKVVAESPSMHRVFDLARRVAAAPNSSALILGESGVGKEVVATFIHETSQRSRGPFVRVNMAAVPDSMVEAELFGTVKGAFTDAKRDRAGHFATADGGTILLDELCEFRIDMQPKLLRVLEERRFYPVGSDRERRVNVRVLAATNRDPEEAMVNGLLREDLYYRLSTVVIQVPPLRERMEDVLPLARAFLHGFGPEFGRPGLQLSEEAEAQLLDHAWPGNVRELRNVIERAVMMTDGRTIEPRALQLRLPAPQSSGALRAVAVGREGPSSERDARPVGPPYGAPAGPAGQPSSGVLWSPPGTRSVLSSAEFPPRDGSSAEPPSFEPSSDAHVVEASDGDSASVGGESASWRLDEARQRALDAAEREHIARVLRRVGGSKTRAAELLGISRSTLWEKLKRYGMS